MSITEIDICGGIDVKRIIYITAVLLLLCISAANAADWPQFRGPNSDGISPEKGINKNWKQKTPKLLWKTQMNDGGYAGPSVYKGTVYIIDHNGNKDVIRGIDINTGKDKWSFTYQDADKPNYGYTRSTPTIKDDMLYVVSRLGLVGCVDLKTGNAIWSGYLGQHLNGRKPTWDYAMSPLIDGDKVILVPGAQDGCVFALDKSNGNLVWKGGNDGAGYSTPVKATIQNIPQYVVFSATGIGGYNASNGTPLWFVKWKTEYDVNAAQPIVTGNSVYITSGYGKGCALIDIDKNMQPQIRWQSKAIQAHFNSSILVNGYIYGIGDPGNLVCLNPKDGSVVWSKDGFEKGGVISVDGTIIAQAGANGDVVLAACDSSGYKELGRFTPLGGESWTTPVVADGKLIVRNKTTLACYDLK